MKSEQQQMDLSHCLLVAFDMDGVLFDTEQAVMESYAEAGAIMKPEDFGKSWREWLNDETIHNKKNAMYLERINAKEIKTLPAYDIYIDNSEVCTILTGASEEPCLAFEKNYGITVDVNSADVKKKAVCIAYLLSGNNNQLVYVDDHSSLGQQIVLHANNLLHLNGSEKRVYFVHYNGQTREELNDQLCALLP